MEPAPNRGRGMDIEHVRVKYNIESCLIRGSMSLKRVALVEGSDLNTNILIPVHCHFQTMPVLYGQEIQRTRLLVSPE
jgi:hypothetical protein